MAGNVKIYPEILIVHEDVVNVKADVCISTVNWTKDLRKGELSSQILKTFGQSLQDALKKVNGNQDLTHGQVVCIPQNVKTFKMVMLVCLKPWSVGNEKTLNGAVYECLRQAAEKGYQSIALPALCMGGLGYPVDKVATALVDGIATFTDYNKESSLNTVHIAMFKQEASVRKHFVKTFVDHPKAGDSTRKDEKSSGNLLRITVDGTVLANAMD